MSVDNMIERSKMLIRKRGWMVQGVSDLSCQCCDDDGRTPRVTGQDPYLYTVGLTAIGLPELLLTLPGKRSMLWMNTGTRLLNAIARHAQHEQPQLWQRLTTTLDEISVVFTPPPEFSRENIWPGLAWELYGRDRVTVLQVEPDW